MNLPNSPITKNKTTQDNAKTLLDKERYLVEEGHVHLTGIQALVRLPLAIL